MVKRSGDQPACLGDPPVRRRALAADPAPADPRADRARRTGIDQESGDALVDVRGRAAPSGPTTTSPAASASISASPNSSLRLPQTYTPWVRSGRQADLRGGHPARHHVVGPVPGSTRPAAASGSRRSPRRWRRVAPARRHWDGAGRRRRRAGCSAASSVRVGGPGLDHRGHALDAVQPADGERDRQPWRSAGSAATSPCRSAARAAGGRGRGAAGTVPARVSDASRPPASRPRDRQVDTLGHHRVPVRLALDVDAQQVPQLVAQLRSREQRTLVGAGGQPADQPGAEPVVLALIHRPEVGPGQALRSCPARGSPRAGRGEGEHGRDAQPGGNGRGRHVRRPPSAGAARPPGRSR